MVTLLSNTSFTVNWIMSDPNYSYTVTWTNLNTGVMDSYTVAENTNSYTVTGLSDNDNYNVTITAVGVCGMIASDPVTVYGEHIGMFRGTYNNLYVNYITLNLCNLFLVSTYVSIQPYTYVCTDINFSRGH